MKYLVLFALIFSCSKSDMKAKQNDQPVDLSNVTIIDVRSKSEFDSGHIEGALHIPHTEIQDRIAQAVPDKSKRVMLYCASGGRSGSALRVLKSMGYTHATNEGGIAQFRQKLNQ